MVGVLVAAGPNCMTALALSSLKDRLEISGDRAAGGAARSDGLAALIEPIAVAGQPPVKASAVNPIHPRKDSLRMLDYSR